MGSSALDNQTLGVIAAVVVIVGSVIYLSMGSGVSSSKPSKDGGSSQSKSNSAGKNAEENVSIDKYM